MADGLEPLWISLQALVRAKHLQSLAAECWYQAQFGQSRPEQERMSELAQIFVAEAARLEGGVLPEHLVPLVACENGETLYEPNT